MKYDLPRRFHLERREDVSGTSGTGAVAQGVQFVNGQCAMTWLTPYTSVSVYTSIDVLERIHGHEGRTIVVWDDKTPEHISHEERPPPRKPEVAR